MSEPTTLHAQVTTDDVHVAATIRQCLIFPHAEMEDAQLVADYRERCLEQMRLNGCEAVRRSEEAAKVAAAIADTAIHELTQNMQSLNAKLTAETALREVAEKQLAVIGDIAVGNWDDAVVGKVDAVLKEPTRYKDFIRSMFKASEERDALAAQVRELLADLGETKIGAEQASSLAVKLNRENGELVAQVAVLREALSAARVYIPEWAREMEGGSIFTRIDKALAATPASASAELATISAHLSDLLALIHRDGGHYEEQRGTGKAVEDAVEQLSTAREDTARLDAILAKCDISYRLPLQCSGDRQLYAALKTRADIDVARKSTT